MSGGVSRKSSKFHSLKKPSQVDTTSLLYSSRKKYIDRAKGDDASFHELSIIIKKLQTALLLMSTEEEEILIQILRQIDEFSKQQDSNVNILQQFNVLSIILEKKFFNSSSNLFVRRYALKIPSFIFEKLTLNEIDAKLINCTFELVKEFYLSEEDDYCIEYISVILSSCIVDPKLADQILHNADIIERLFHHINTTEDPDILHYSYKITNQIIDVNLNAKCPELFEKLPFPIDRILNDLTNQYPEIQAIVLEILRKIINNCNIFIQNRDVFALQQLVKILLNESSKEFHMRATQVLVAAMMLEKMVQLFFEHNILGGVLQYLETLEQKCPTLEIFSEIAAHSSYLERLHYAGITDLLLKCITNDASVGHVILGLFRFLKNPWSCQAIIDYNPIEKILKILQNTILSIKTREYSANLINGLLDKSVAGTSQVLMKLNFPNIVGVQLGLDPKDLSLDFILMLLNIITKLAKDDDHRTQIAASNVFIKTLIEVTLPNSFRSAILITNVFKCLSSIVTEQEVQQSLLAHSLPETIVRGLKNTSTQVKSAVTNFIMLTTIYAKFLGQYIDNGVLEFLITDQKSVYACPTWSPAIESILSQSPSLKFYIHGALTITDKTLSDAGFEDFVVSKKPSKRFQVLLEIMRNEVSPLYSLIVVNFNRLECPVAKLVQIAGNEGGGDEQWTYCRQPGDVNLPKFKDKLNSLLELRGLIETSPSEPAPCNSQTIDFTNMSNRIKIIAEIVANEMCGYNPEGTPFENCTESAVLNHLHLLKCRLHCNIIPLGDIRVGGYFERAILFKALADHIGIPCTLVRGVDGKILYNEIPIPIPENGTDCRLLKYLPNRLLRPTHVVDLMDNIGELYPLDSREALHYLRLI